MAYARTGGPSSMELSSLQTPIKKNHTNSSPLMTHKSLSLSLGQSYYLSRHADSGRGESQQRTYQYTDVSLGALYFRPLSSDQGFWGKAEALLDSSINVRNEFYYGVPELYAGYGQGDHQVVVGRKKEPWSHFDEDWSMGIWQPNLRWDYLNPVSQGLTGAFYYFRRPEVQWTFFVSGVFLPDQGPNFEIVDGNIRSNNPWFWRPQSAASVFNQDTPIYYELRMPAEREIVFQESVAGRLRLGLEDEGAWVQMAYANKPMNQIHLGIHAFHRNDLDRVQAIIYPQSVRHQLLTLESGWQEEEWSGWLSLTAETPEESGVPVGWLESPLNESYFAGATFRHLLFGGRGGQHWLKWAYLHRWERERVRPTTGLDVDSVESSLGRFPHQRVVSLEWGGELGHLASRLFKGGMRYMSSFSDEGSLLTSWANYEVRQNLSFELMLDILGAREQEASRTTGLMSRYRSHDRIVGGLRYVF